MQHNPLPNSSPPCQVRWRCLAQAGLLSVVAGARPHTGRSALVSADTLTFPAPLAAQILRLISLILLILFTISYTTNILSIHMYSSEILNSFELYLNINNEIKLKPTSYNFFIFTHQYPKPFFS